MEEGREFKILENYQKLKEASVQTNPDMWIPDPKDFMVANQSGELQLSPDKDASFAQIASDSMESFNTYLPNLKPKEPTRFLLLKGNSSSKIIDFVSGGEYMGRVGAAHYISLRLPADICVLPGEFTPEQQEMIRIAVEHELLHQSHAEIIGQQNMMMRDHSSDETDQDLIDYQYVQSLKAKSPRNKGRGISMTSAVTEGAATLGELHLLVKRIEELKESGESERLHALEDYKSNRFGKFKDSLRMCRADLGAQLSSHAFGTPYAVGVVHIMNGLYRKFGLENMREVISKIDLNRCRDIRMGSQEFADISADPSLLPGLEDIKL